MFHSQYDCHWSCWLHRPLTDPQIALLMIVITAVCLGVVIFIDRTLKP